MFCAGRVFHCPAQTIHWALKVFCFRGHFPARLQAAWGEVGKAGKACGMKRSLENQFLAQRTDMATRATGKE